ncbi:N-acetylmuramidase family protein [Vibrio gazogenes]|uniref:N-acetylmuramidase domain-containing protein n=1 Tax=Vibrio gazogenes DSM 21264 = NBRC 103151 TaxID=1123492 RepID=A0A1M5HII3_VIBGA|nr:N-acetylmuramidase family protein [Vibrio gazogenes]USP13256.1 N-acetylmuramidase family protein [Vibrio gazogenes]SHG15760.1 Protein of unknown function [Vibrio gazogenes DSM 21264] [Vibrio gazogenes DSM 21264 = NBRC 103151]SJN56696.1 hypothetical protein BQ6471_02164 [Vibrio gazogenes]
MQELELTASVGNGADNSPEDVLNIQKALNQIAGKIGLLTPLAEDGQIIDAPDQSPTCQAIGLLQTTLLGYRHPDNRIDCGGKSEQALKQALLPTPAYIPDLALPESAPQRGLSEQDYQDASELLSCDVAAIKAVSDVESSGSGFYASGAPCLLFEAHQFSKYSDHRFDDSHPDISSPKWNRALYAGGEKEYDRLQQALTLDREAALKSASYGRYQIMGFNHQSAGYEDVESFVRDMFLAERHHLMAFVHFIQSNPKLLSAIQSLDWATFARYYNGPGYAENHYDEKLQRAYEHHQG